MPQINVLVVPSDRFGVGKFRSIEPHIFLQNNFSGDFFVEIDLNPPLEDLEFYKKFQIVVYHRSITNDFDRSYELVEKLKGLGIVTVCDMDDYWNPTKDHPIYDVIMYNKINEKIVRSIKQSDWVTTTTSLFADEIRKYNKNVFVLPNAINPDEPQFKEKTIESDKLRVGWLGGSSHLSDIQLLDSSFAKLSQNYKDLQFVLCGFDTRGTITEINGQTGEHKKRPIKPEETVWARYEEIFTQNYKYVSPEFEKVLKKYTQDENTEFGNESYRRVWTLPVTSYAKNYAKFDVSLAPIKNHMFNRMKSQLKVIEAGFYKKALIATNLGPYTLDLKHCLKNGEFTDGNALLVDENRNHGDWAKFIIKLQKNPSLVTDMGERLYETVSKKYDLNIVTRDRADFYKSLIK
jgi:glycosyltransferase involved in cell wall biosynthesis